MKSTHPWIKRQITDDIFERISVEDSSVLVYYIHASAGMGKTFAGRDIGTRCGSQSGYEPARMNDLFWSGILDLYDPDTNSNQGIERRLVQAFGENYFEDYLSARADYDFLFKGGITDISMEEQRQNVQAKFTDGLKIIAKNFRPIIVFDTVERLEGGSDPTQQQMGLFYDSSTVIGWLLSMIAGLERGVVILLGRPNSRFLMILQDSIKKNEEQRRNRRPVELIEEDLPDLNEKEIEQFFNLRQVQYEEEGLGKYLDEELEQRLQNIIGGKPLMLDLILQTLLETKDATYIKNTLDQINSNSLKRKADQKFRNENAPETLVHYLVKGYMECFKDATKKSNRNTLLHYLTIARNGLFDELLDSLEGERNKDLKTELHSMENLPFIRVRTITFHCSDINTYPSARKMFFLHDALYSICDEVLLQPGQIASDSQHIVDWYDTQITSTGKETSLGSRHGRPLLRNKEMMVESLIYRMRANPQTGYEWFLRMDDLAIRSAETGLDIRLRDGVSIFLTMALEDPLNLKDSLASKIDIDNVKVNMPSLKKDYSLDSATLWIKRLMQRGQLVEANWIGETMQETVEYIYLSNPQHYLLAYSEFHLWWGQVRMYNYNITEAMKSYKEQRERIESEYKPVKTTYYRNGKMIEGFERWRLILVYGRLLNNEAFSNWMYMGRLQLAEKQLHDAIHLFRGSDLHEELANSEDNLGRVMAELGREFESIQLIKAGRDLRIELELNYRIALSQTSLAIAYCFFAQYENAQKTIEIAMTIFSRIGAPRGIGLAQLFRGWIHRNIAEAWRDLGMDATSALSHLDIAERDFRDAIQIFSKRTPMSQREIQAKNELACCYRSRYLLHRLNKGADTDLDQIFRQGRYYFRQAIEVATQKGFPLEVLDNKQDLAVLYARAHKYNEAQMELNEIRQMVESKYGNHLLRKGFRISSFSYEERVDAVYRLMGSVELLEGAIEYDRQKPSDDPDSLPPIEALIETARHYLLAITYFNIYSDEKNTKRLTYARMYTRFEACDPDFIHDLNEVYFTKWMKEYCIPKKLIKQSLQEIFGLFD